VLRVLDQLQTRKAVVNEWDLSPCGPFMMSLYCKWKGDGLTLAHRSKDDLGIYEGVLEQWVDIDKLADEISTVLTTPNLANPFPASPPCQVPAPMWLLEPPRSFGYDQRR